MPLGSVTVSVTFSEHIDLLDLHGRAGAASLGQLQPDQPVPPRGTVAREVLRDHWATLEIWAWSLENPTGHWSARAEPDAPVDHAGQVAGVVTQVERLEAVLLGSGPDVELDYFGQSGTAAQVARLVAHEAITVAHAASLAAERSAPALSPTVAADGLDQSLGHWESPEAPVKWQPVTMAVRATDIESAWHLELGQANSGATPEFRLVAAADPVVVVEGAAVDLLWWLHGHALPDELVRCSGPADVVAALRSALDHPVRRPPRKRRRWFG